MKFKSLLAVLGFTGLVSACVEPQLTSYTDPDYTGGAATVGDIAVLGTDMTLKEREAIEREAVGALREGGKAAITTLTLQPPTREFDQDTLTVKLQEQGIESLLMISAEGKERSVHVSPAIYHPGYFYTRAYKKKGEVYYVRHYVPGYYSGGHTYDRTLARYTARLIDLDTGRTIWRADGEISGGTRLDKIAEDMARATVKKLAEDRLIPPRP